ncbi:MAG: hypothetical protein ACFFCS_02085 [Candidatus Hodarchaeota archaeon]
MLKSTNEGYRALFDPLYVPPFVIGLDKEEHLIKGFLEDNYSLNSTNNRDFRVSKAGASVMIDGIKGIGKSTLTRKVSTDIIHSKHYSSQDFINISINCLGKDENQILQDLINGLGIELDYPTLVKLDSRVAWSLIANVSQKKKRTIINVLLNNTESLQFNFYKKLVYNLKNLGINLLITTNVRNNQYFLDNVDLNLSLHAYSVKNLNKIVDQRCDIAFPGHRTTFPRFITDSVLEFDTARPEPCISILRHAYPDLRKGDFSDFSLEKMQNCCKDVLPDIIYNEFSLIDSFNDAPVQMLVFLDNIASFFEDGSKYYIDREDLLDLYGMACENLEMKGTKIEFEDFLARFRANHVLLKSNNDDNTFFTMIPVNFLKFYLDEIFN